MKKSAAAPGAIDLVENPDVLASVAAAGNARPALVVGFAAETDDIVDNARKKLGTKAATGSWPTTSRRNRNFRRR